MTTLDHVMWIMQMSCIVMYQLNGVKYVPAVLILVLWSTVFGYVVVSLAPYESYINSPNKGNRCHKWKDASVNFITVLRQWRILSFVSQDGVYKKDKLHYDTIHYTLNRIYNKILDRDWFSARLFVVSHYRRATDHVGDRINRVAVLTGRVKLHHWSKLSDV